MTIVKVNKTSTKNYLTKICLTYVCSLFLICLTVNCFSQASIEKALKKYNTNSIEYISINELSELIKQKQQITLLDARTIEEFQVSHIQNAIWISDGNIEVTKLLNYLPKNEKLIVYCSIGVRSEQIGEQLQKAGFTNVYNLYGGIFEWFNQGNKIYNLQEQQTDYIHAYNIKWGKFIKGGTKVYE